MNTCSKHSKRELTNAVLYLVDSGCKWRQLPHDFPPVFTVHSFYRRARLNGLWAAIAGLLFTKLTNIWQVLPKRWIVERTFAWLNHSRRLSKDYELTVASAETLIKLSSAATLIKISHIHTLLKRL